MSWALIPTLRVVAHLWLHKKLVQPHKHLTRHSLPGGNMYSPYSHVFCMSEALFKKHRALHDAIPIWTW